MRPAVKLQAAPTLESLTLAWLMAKEREAAANAERLQVEQQLVALLPGESEGTTSQIVSDYRVSVRYGVTRKVDSDKLRELWADLPSKAQEAFKWSAAVALPKLRALQEYMPAEYARLAAVIETKPSKASVSVDLVEKEVV